MKGMKILVTGSEGQLGRELRDVLHERGVDGAVFASHGELDICDATAVEAFVATGGYSHIVNCAAYTAVDRAEEDRQACHAVNAVGPANLARAAAACGAKFVHISTDYVFAGDSSAPYNESDAAAPATEYGRAKLAGETAVLEHAPDAVIIRTGWLYSSYGHNFVKTMLRLASEGKSLRVVSDQTGTPTYAADLAAAIATIVLDREWRRGIYHYADEGVASWYDLAVESLHAAGLHAAADAIEPIPTTAYPTPAPRPRYSVLSKQKIKETYRISIPHWRQSLCRCINRISQAETWQTSKTK